jgi:hypothetical protein
MPVLWWRSYSTPTVKWSPKHKSSIDLAMGITVGINDRLVIDYLNQLLANRVTCTAFREFGTKRVPRWVLLTADPDSGTLGPVQ